jgi:hypothetical protein
MIFRFPLLRTGGSSRVPHVVIRGPHARSAGANRCFVAIVCVAGIVGCGSHTTALGGPPNVGPTATVAPTQTPVAAVTPVAFPSVAPFSAGRTATVALPAAGANATPMPIALPSAGGFGPTLLLPLPQSAVNVQVTQVVSNVAPAGAPALSTVRAAAAVRRGLARPQGSAVLLYTELFFTTTVTLASTPSFSFVIPSGDVVPGVGYYVALFDPTRPSLGWQYGFEGPATLAGTTLTFAPASGSFTFSGNLTYSFALVAIPTGEAAPTAAPSIAPTSVPTQTPPPIVVVSPSPSASASPSGNPSASPSAGASASPSPSPSGSASASPTSTPLPSGSGGIGIAITVPTPAPIVCVPANVTVAAGATVTASCSQAHYAGAFTFSVSDPSIATAAIPSPRPLPSLAPTAPPTGPATPTPHPATPTPVPTAAPGGTPPPAAPTAPPAPFAFTVTGLKAGTTTLSVTAQDGGVGSVSVTVTP